MWEFQAERIVYVQAWGQEVAPSTLVMGVSGVALYRKLSDSSSRCLYRPPPRCLPWCCSFSGNHHSAHINPIKSSSCSKIFNSLAIARRRKSKLLSMALQVLPRRPAFSPPMLWACSCPGPTHSGLRVFLSSSPSACEPRLALCKSNIHPSRLSSNTSSWRHHVAFCQFEFLLNNCYCKINDRRQSVPTARCIFFFFTAALIIETRKSHFLSSTYCVHHTNLSPRIVFENSLNFTKETPFYLHFTDEETDSEMWCKNSECGP